MAKTKLKVEIDADSAKFNKKMKALGATVVGVGVAIAGIGILAGVAFVRMAKDVAKANDEIGKTAKKLQISNEELQKLQLLAQFAGIGSKGVEGAFRGLGTKILDLKKGLASAKDEFSLLGLAAGDFGEDTFQNFLKVLFALEKVEDKQIKLALANKIMGRQGGAFLAALGSEAGGLAKIMDRVDSNSSLFISDKEIDQAESMNDQFAELQLSQRKLKSVISSQTFPAFESLTRKATEFIKTILDNESFPDLIEKIGATAGKLATFFEKAIAGFDMTQFIKDLIKILDILQDVVRIMDELGIDELIKVAIASNQLGLTALTGTVGALTSMEEKDSTTQVLDRFDQIGKDVKSLNGKLPNLTK